MTPGKFLFFEMGLAWLESAFFFNRKVPIRQCQNSNQLLNVHNAMNLLPICRKLITIRGKFLFFETGLAWFESASFNINVPIRQ
jgi:hypothetical protein